MYIHTQINVLWAHFFITCKNVCSVCKHVYDICKCNVCVYRHIHKYAHSHTDIIYIAFN